MQHRSWKNETKETLSNPDDLLNRLNFKTSPKISTKAQADFPLRVPRSFIQKIANDDVDDPLLKQIFPSTDEELDTEGFSKDPLAEKNSQPTPGLLQKYQGRVLLVLTGACAIHCRYCFRRHFPYATSNPSGEKLEQALDHIKNDNSIHEVILSGGDPLSVSDAKLAKLLKDLSAIPHLRRLRIHTRYPIVIPERVTDELAQMLEDFPLPIVLVVHVNHANELDENVAKSINKLNTPNISMLNQSVLLKGVNDSARALVNLSERLFSMGILPYYLHSLDPVSGASHFEVDEPMAISLMQDIQKELPGYLVPKLVREECDKPHKTLISF